MSVTLQIDDDLYQQVLAEAARSGRQVSDLVSEGIRSVVRPDEKTAGKSRRVLGLDEVFAMADEMLSKAPVGKTAREILMEDRARLDGE